MSDSAVQSTACEEALSVLVISPDPKVHGGVTVFAEMLKAHLRGFHVSAFWVGSIPGQTEKPWALMRRVLAAPFAIAHKVRREGIDVVHINPSLTLQSILRDGLIIFLLRLTGFRHVLVYFHGWDLRVEQRVRRTQILRRVLVWLLNGSSHVTVLAPEFKETLIRMGVASERVTFTRTMFDGDSIRAVQIDPPARRKVLFMSRFERAKGVYELVEAFARIKDRFPDTDLIMAGGGELESDGVIARAAALGLGARIAFPGYVRGEEKVRLLKSCTLFTLPTYLGEGMPIALLEAMGAGKPLLTSKAGSIGHITRDPDNGVVLDRVTVDSVETGLVRLLSDPETCAKVGRHNEEYAFSRFEAEAVTREIEAMYRQIARAA